MINLSFDGHSVPFTDIKIGSFFVYTHKVFLKTDLCYAMKMTSDGDGKVRAVPLQEYFLESMKVRPVVSVKLDVVT